MTQFSVFEAQYSMLVLVIWSQVHSSTATDFSSAAFVTVKSHRLIDSIITERGVNGVLDCVHFCLLEYPVCTSVNYEIKDNLSFISKHKCQLNNESRSHNSVNLVEDKMFNYLEPIPEVLQKEIDEIMSADHRSFEEPFSATFTNLGATGRFGPTSLGTFYIGQDHENIVTVANGIQQWTVPYTGTYQITAVGAAGGYDSSGSSVRGRGAYMRGDFDLNKGEVIKILVGQKGLINNGRTSSGGGGGTFVVTSSNKALIVAGGGGGKEGLTVRLTNCDASTTTTGKQHQCKTSSSCSGWSGGSSGRGASEADHGNSGGGGGGFKSNGRSSNTFGGSSGIGGEGGKSFLHGGAGGRSQYYNAVGGFGGGGGAFGSGGGAGGGGGYSGGASGDNVHGSCGGGGGSYNDGANQNNVEGYQENGHGFVDVVRILRK